MKKYAALIAAIVCAPVWAQSIGVTVFSKHSAGNWNENNPGIYFVSKSGWTIGTFKNSESNQSKFAGKTFSADLGWCEGGAFVGAVTGYKGGTTAAVIPSIYCGSKSGVRLMFAPKVNRNGAAALLFAYERKI